MTRVNFFAAAIASLVALPALAAGDDPSAPFYVPGEPVHDEQVFAFFYGNRLEYQSREGDETLLWDFDAWLGQDWNKLWIKTEGTYNLEDGAFNAADVELLYNRPYSAYWNAQIGVRHDFVPDKDDRTFASLGVQGLAPGFINVDPTLFVSTEGDVSISAEVEYDQLLTQRLILQPRIEVGFQFQDVPDYDLGSGFTEVEIGTRLRYEVTREFAPYVGVSLIRSVGETEDILRAAGEDVTSYSVVGGVRLVF